MPEQAQAGVAQLLGQLSPLLLGAQVGTVLGTLAQQVLGQYDIAVPRPDGAGALLFVVPNIARFEKDWSLDPTEFRTWIAIHEVTHRFEFARHWALKRFRELIDDFVHSPLTSATPAATHPRPVNRRSGISPGRNPIQGGHGRRATAQAGGSAFMTAAEGYGDHVIRAQRPRCHPYARIDEAMRRY
jgi:uncharacterized protein (DUF2342 family)